MQSLERTLGLLELMADLGGECALSELAGGSRLPLATVHRLIGTLVAGGYVRRDGARRYVLGPRLIRLGEVAGQAVGLLAEPTLSALADLVGESANLAMLNGDRVIYLAQSPGRHAMRMFTEPGRQVDAHCTAVGKAMLAQLPEGRVRQVLARTGQRGYTDSTITDPDALLEHLASVRRHGYAVDDGEQEVGVRCVAVALPGDEVTAAISVSAPAERLPREVVRTVVPALSRFAGVLAARLAEPAKAP